MRVGQNAQIVHIRDAIQEYTRWSSYFIYIVHPGVTVAEGATLTILPGTTVKFEYNYNDRAGLEVDGTLIADGTVEIRDDTLCVIG